MAEKAKVNMDTALVELTKTKAKVAAELQKVRDNLVKVKKAYEDAILE